jgi:Uma2 family endonuclease
MLLTVDPAQKLSTWEDLLRLPEDAHAEIIAGVLTTPPSPLPRHSRAQGALRSFLGRPFDDDDGRGGPGGWWILLEVDVRLSLHDIVRPDLAGWHRGRLPDPWDARPIDVAPDWICEVLSRSNAAQDRVRKRELYARAGVPYYWLVDPDARTLEALRLDAVTHAWMEVGAYGDEAIARIAPFEAIQLELSRLFPPAAGGDSGTP